MEGVENTESSKVWGQEEHWHYVVAYPPIPRGFIKEEPKSDDDQDESNEEGQLVVAYPPLPQVDIKDELETGEGCDGFISGREQLMTQFAQESSDQETQKEKETTKELDSEEEDTDNDKGNDEGSEHSSLEDFDESDSSLSADLNEASIPSPKAGPSKKPARLIQKASHRKKRENGSNPTASKERPFKCSKCEKSYKHKSFLTFHIQHECGIALQFSCTQCDGQFKRKNNLKMHLISIHKIDRLQLDEYGYSGSGLRERQGKPFKCTKCESSYKQKRALDQHTKYECGNPFHCTLCNQNCATKCSLRSHLLRVHNIARHNLDKYGAGFKVRPIHPFKCDQCGRSYIRKNALTRHLTAECGVEPSLPCPQCNCLCKRKESLKLHLIEIHKVEPSQLTAYGLGPVVRPENPFKCDRCGTSYKRKYNLNRHLAKKYGK